jgi:predicted dehydrogenase
VGLTAAASTTVMAERPALSQTARSRARIRGANERIGFAVVGCGARGRADMLALLRAEHAACVAVCDIDEEQTSQVLRLLDDHRLGRPTLRTQDFREVLQRKEVDAVVVATPDHWHALVAAHACAAGKDVYLETPVSLTIGEGPALARVARRHERIVQVGIQERSAPHVREAVAFIREGGLGRIRLVRTWTYLPGLGPLAVVPDDEISPYVDYDLWLGPARNRPFNMNRFHGTYRWFWDYAGGVLTQQGSHLLDIVHWALGLGAPASAFASGGKLGFPEDARETPDTLQVLWRYGGGLTVQWEHVLGLGRGPEGRDQGIAFAGDEGVLVLDRHGWEVQPEISVAAEGVRYRRAGVPRQPARQDADVLHAASFLEAVRSRRAPVADLESGHAAALACHLANISFRVGRPVRWDGQRIAQDPQAQSHVLRSYRAPWRMPA